METITTYPITVPIVDTMPIGRLVTRVTDAAASRAEQSRAYGEIVRRFQDMAFACAYALLGDAQLAEDAAQEAFITAWRSIEDLREPDAFPGWFRCIVRTQCCRMTRGTRSPTIPLDSLAPLLAAPSSQDPLLAVVRAEQQSTVRSALASLPEHERLATVLYYLGSWDQKEIAAFLEVPTTTVKKRLFSARKRLRERIAPIMFPDETAADNAVRKALTTDLPSVSSRFADTVALWTAIDTNDAPMVRELLGREPGLAGVRNREGETPLHLACSWGHTESATALLQQGADPNVVRDGDGATSLHALAAGSVRLEILESLLTAGAILDTKDRVGRTAVQIAALRSAPLDEVDSDSFRFAETLIDRGAANDLWTAAALNNTAAVPALTAMVNGRNVDGNMPLHIAARAGHRSVIKTLLNAGAEVDAVNTLGQTPLRLAVQPGHSRCCRRNTSAETVLRERGASDDIFIVALTGDVERLAALIGGNPDLINARDGDGATPLCLAAWNGQRAAAAWLLERGADVQARDRVGNGPASVRYRPADVETDIIDLVLSHGAVLELKTAIALGRAESVEALLRHDPALVTAEVRDWALENITDASLIKRLFSPDGPLNLLQAASLGATGNIRLLLDRDPAALHRRDDRRETPLHRCAERGHKDAVLLLLSRGASPDAVGGDGGTPLHRAAGMGGAEIVSALLTGGARSTLTDFRGETALYGAVRSGDTESVRLLLLNGAPIETVVTGQMTLLHTAAEKGNAAAAQLLVERGANLQAKNHWGATPLHLATREGHADIARLLLEAGTDKTARDDWYRTPLHLAVWFGQTTIAEILLAAGVSVSELAYGYSTPLHTAAGAGQVPAAALLIARGADVNYPTDFKRTPLHDAVQSGCLEMVSLLLSHGANPNAVNDRGMSPLHWAAAAGKTDIAHRLRAAGADTSLRSRKNETPRDIAIRYSNRELAEALV